MVSIILPSKDEKNLPKVIDGLDYHLLFVPYEIIVVIGDKNKKNLSLLDLRNSMATAHPVKIKIFKSYGDSLERAILLGFSVARGDKIIVMDADGSHTSEIVPQMIKELNSSEMVVASRFVKGSIFSTSPFRRLVTFVFNSYAKLMGSTLTDPMSGFFGIRADILKKMKFKPFKWKIALEINNKLHPKTKEVPFNFKAFTEKGRSLFHNWKLGMKILWDITVYAL